MRRQDREIRNASDIHGMLRRNNIPVVSMLDGSRPCDFMTVYAFSLEDGCVALHFHGAAEGCKAETRQRNPGVFFKTLSELAAMEYSMSASTHGRTRTRAATMDGASSVVTTA